MKLVTGVLEPGSEKRLGLLNKEIKLEEGKSPKIKSLKEITLP